MLGKGGRFQAVKFASSSDNGNERVFYSTTLCPLTTNARVNPSEGNYQRR